MVVSTRSSVFVETLHKSGLLTPQEYHDLVQLLQAVGLHPQDHKAVAKWCVKQGYLTTFQAEQLLRGKWRNFIINHKYKVLEPLGQGGMGAVFRCEHIILGKEVAIKILPTELTRNPAALQRFLREAQALAALNHPNIVQAHDVDEHRGQYFLVMSCVDGRTLLDLVRQDGPLTVAQAANYVTQACHGLQHAHEAGWVHRDLKPGNLILDKAGMIKIMDFGLARLATSDGSVTRDFKDCNVLGSPDYISPEQAMNSPDIDIRADIYSLGATLYFLLIGRGPFEGEALLQKLLAHQMREPEEVSLFRNDIPPELDAVLKKMMTKQPAGRFATPREVEQALKPWANRQDSGAMQTTPPLLRNSRTVRVPRVAATPDTIRAVTDPLGETFPSTPAYAAAPAPAPEESEWAEPEPAAAGLSRRTKYLLAGAAAVLVLVALGMVLTLWLMTPADRSTRLAQVDQLGRQKQWAPAAKVLASLLREDPENSKERKETYSRIRNWLPTTALLLEQFPQDVELNRIAASHYLKEQDFDKAISCLKLATAAGTEANDGVLWHRIADGAVPQRQWSQAVFALEQAFRVKGDNPDWSRDRGVVYAALGDIVNYQRVCRETLERFRGKTATRKHKMEMMYVFGQALPPQNVRLDEVIQMGNDVLKEKRNDGHALFRHAAVLYRAGRWQEAIRHAKEAKTHQRGWADHRLCDPLLAMAHYQAGFRDEARRTLDAHRAWAVAETAKRPKTPYVPLLSTWWDSMTMDTLWREAETLIEGKSR
jgi:eukaryotic-like serine/threonine-protein kinase